MKILEKPPLPAPTEAEILRKLNHHCVPHHTWGQGNRRSLSEFMSYATKDRFDLRNGLAHEPLIIDVQVMVVRVFCRVGGRMLELFEEKQICKGHILHRNGFDGIAETMKRTDRSLNDSAHRCLREELSFNDFTSYSISPCMEVQIRDPLPSEKWPDPNNRVHMVFHRHIHECMIARRIFKAQGYVEHEVEHDRRIYFKWKICERMPLFFST